ncbi:MAG: hypothetical protein KDL87_14935, partial [Verrucomicrobiae bacterium]|nr:hypothetical protein [Verrucomicrobiae bacterium]
SCRDLESLEFRISGAYPLAVVGKLDKLTALATTGDVTLGSASGDGTWPALRFLSLANSEIEDPEGLGDFLSALPKLQSLSLPDLQEMDVSGLAKCPELTVISLGDECHDPGAAGVGTLPHLSIALLNAKYGADEIAGLASSGRLGKVRIFRTGPSVDFTQLPQLRRLSMLGDQDAFEMASLKGIGRPFSLEATSLTEADLAALASVAGDLPITSLSLKFPNLATLEPLPALPQLAFLRLENQLVTFDQKITSLELSEKFPALKGVELSRLQNLETVTSGGPEALEEVFIHACDALTKVALPSGGKAHLKAVNCPKLKPGA